MTYRGRTIARLIPASRRARGGKTSAAVWSDLDRLAVEIGARWPRGRSAVGAVQEGRRRCDRRRCQRVGEPSGSPGRPPCGEPTWLEEQAGGGDLVISPTLLLAEVAGALSRRIGQPDSRTRLFSAPTTDRTSPGARRRQTGALCRTACRQIGLRGADAVYVATAHQLNVPLVTLDREQQARAGRLVEVRSPGQRAGRSAADHRRRPVHVGHFLYPGCPVRRPSRVAAT